MVSTLRLYRAQKNAKTFATRGLHFYSSRFFIYGRSATQRADGHAGTGHAFPSAAGYYFSRRIFPQMNFMKTVFALLINRSSVGEPTARHSSSRTDSSRAKQPGRARLLVIILFQRSRAQRKRAATLIPFSRFRRAIRDLRDLRKLAATLHTDVPFFFFLFDDGEKGAPGKMVSAEIMTLASQVACS